MGLCDGYRIFSPGTGRRILRRPGVALALIGVLAGPLLAEEPAVLTWLDCARLAAQRNPDLLAAVRAMEAGRAQYRESFNRVLPRIDLSNSYTDSSAALSSTAQSWQAQGSARLDLIDINQWAGIQTAAASFRQSQANRQVVSSSALLSLYKAFAALLYAQEQIGVAKDIHDLWDRNAQLVELRYQSGRESKGNALRTRAERLQAETALRQSRRDLRVAQQQMGQALGQDAFSALAVTGTWTVAAVSATPPDFDAWADRLPAVRAQRAAADMARASLKAARSALWPALSLTYAKGVVGSSEFPSNPFWSFTGAVNYPLLGSGPSSAYFAISAAGRAHEKALEILRSARHQARTALESAWSGLAQAQDQVKVRSAFLEAATQRKKESDILYQNGLLSFQNWELLTNDYVNSQKDFLSAQQNVILAEAQWRFASGEQLGEPP